MILGLILGGAIGDLSMIRNCAVSLLEGKIGINI
jgi:hypothetical protein